MSWSKSLSTSRAALCGRLMTLGHGIEIILQFGLPGASRHRLRLGDRWRCSLVLLHSLGMSWVFDSRAFYCQLPCWVWLLQSFCCVLNKLYNRLRHKFMSYTWGLPLAPKTAVGIDRFIFTYGTWSLVYWNFDLLLPAIFRLSCHLSVLWPLSSWKQQPGIGSRVATFLSTNKRIHIFI